MRYNFPKNQKIWVPVALVSLAINFVLLTVTVTLLRRNAPSGKIQQDFVKNDPYPLIDIARNFIPQENFIVNIQPLREELIQFAEKIGPDSISLYFEFLNTGANISINKELKLWPASLAKLPVGMVIFKKAETGNLPFDKKIVISRDDLNSDSGALSQASPGMEITVAKLLEELLVNSDNTAYNILLRQTSEADIDGIIEEVGLNELFTEDGKVSAKEYSRIFRSLYTSSFLKRENSQKILEMLARSRRNYAATGIPENVTYSHKYGENVNIGVYLDSGIVYLPNRSYLLTVMLKGKGVSKEEDYKFADETMKTISEKVYNYLSEYKQ